MIPILTLIAVLIISGLVFTGISGSASRLGWKLSGIWSNQSDTLQIMLHEEDACLHGHVVSAQVREKNEKMVVGKRVVDKIELKPSWNWSTGKYVDPYTMKEFVLKVKLIGNNRLKVRYLESNNLMRSEEWKLVNHL